MNRDEKIHFFVINLRTAVERRSSMMGELAKAGMSHEFFPAIDAHKGDSNPPFPLAARSGRYGLQRSTGEMACFASHYLLWRRSMLLKEPVGILEDDLQLMEGFSVAARLAFDHVGNGLVRLCGLEDKPSVTIRRLEMGFRLVQFLKGPSGTQAYVISPAAAAALVGNCLPIRDPVDEYIDRFWVHGVASSAVLPWKVAHLAGQSSVEHAPAPRGLRRLRYKASRQLDSLRRRKWLRHHMDGGLPGHDEIRTPAGTVRRRRSV